MGVHLQLTHALLEAVVAARPRYSNPRPCQQSKLLLAGSASSPFWPLQLPSCSRTAAARAVAVVSLGIGREVFPPNVRRKQPPSPPPATVRLWTSQAGQASVVRSCSSSSAAGESRLLWSVSRAAP
jgi:hypothetical protein